MRSRHFRDTHPAPSEASDRVPHPRYLYYGQEIWESAAAALLCGEHLLLAGPKATGKNVLAENLAAVFGRPVWDVSMYVNVDAAALIGADTLQDGRVVVPGGPRLQVRPPGRLRRAGRGEHGQKRGSGRSPRHTGPPPGH